jgi:hypothetical protein
MLTGIYGWGTARFERKVRRELAVTDPVARAVDKLLDPMIKKAKRDIRDGTLASMEQVRRKFEIRKGDRE